MNRKNNLHLIFFSAVFILASIFSSFQNPQYLRADILTNIKNFFQGKKEPYIGDQLIVKEGYEKMSDGNTVIYYPDNDKYDVRQIMDYFNTELKSCLEDINCKYDPNKKRNIILFSDEKKYTQYAPRDIFGSGCYSPDTHTILIDSSNIINFNRTFAHEIAHMGLSEKCKSQLPRGLEEGFARYREALTVNEKDNLDFAVASSRNAHQKIYYGGNKFRVYSMRELLSGSYPKFKGKNEKDEFYYQGTSLTMFLKSRMKSDEDLVEFMKNPYSSSNLRKYGFKSTNDLKGQWYLWEDRPTLKINRNTQ